MAFLNPLLLFGMAAVSVPIIIHLLNRRKFERVVWAAMRFIQVSIEQNQRRLQIEDLLLLLLRCLMVALIAMALSRPTLGCREANLFGQSTVTTVVVLDNSQSMGATDGVRTRFDRGKEAAGQAIDALPSGSSVAVILASDVASGLIPEPTQDITFARRKIKEARLSDRATDLLPSVREAAAILERKGAARKEIYVITDGQLAGFRQLEQIRQSLDKAKAEVRSYVVLVGNKEERNLALTGLAMTTPIATSGQPLRFTVQVTNFGKADERDVRVNLRVNQDPASDEGVVEVIPPGQSRSVALTARLRAGDGGAAMHHTVTASIATPDRIPADDSRTLALRSVGAVKVLLVDGSPAREARDTETFYLRGALVPVPVAERDSYFVKATVINPAELESAKIDDYDAVVLANVSDLGKPTADQLEAYVRRGGGLIVFPGEKLREQWYNDELLKARGLLPAAFGQALGEPIKPDQPEQKSFTLQDKGFDHPISVIWNDTASGTPSVASIFKAYILQPDTRKPPAAGKPAGGGSLPEDVGEPAVVLQFAVTPKNGAIAGKPFVLERRVGLGRVIQFGSSATTSWHNLPTRTPGVFLPLVERCVGAIVSRPEESLNLRVGQPLLYRDRALVDLIGRDAVISAPKPREGGPAADAGEKSAAKESRRIELLRSIPQLKFEETDVAGAYEARVEGERDPIRFAAQSDPGESSLEEVTEQQLDAVRTVASVLRPGEAGQLGDLVAKERVGTELWFPLAMAALVIGVMETILAQWFSKAK